MNILTEFSKTELNDFQESFVKVHRTRSLTDFFLSNHYSRLLYDASNCSLLPTLSNAIKCLINSNGVSCAEIGEPVDFKVRLKLLLTKCQPWMLNVSHSCPLLPIYKLYSDI